MQSSVKKYVIFVLSLYSLVGINTSSAQDWIWIKGSSQSDQFGHYGTKGADGSTNTPGARSDALTWTGRNGNLWLYGGVGNSSIQRGGLNDLWKFDKSTGNWTWMKGDSTSTQQLSVFGTQGVASPENTPGIRMWSSGWTDADGNLWLFGGFSEGDGSDAGTGGANYGDLWKYDAQTGYWTWMKGSNLRQKFGHYGTKGIEDPENTPGSRWLATSWTDLDGNFWLFGGVGLGDASNTSSGHLQDLWKYDVQTGNWTWMKGSGSIDQTVNQGTKGIADPTNLPAGRLSAESWVDKNGNLWMFGGDASVLGNGNVFSSVMNDLWMFDIRTNEWTWITGTASLDFFNPLWTIDYGVMGTPSTGSHPGPRKEAVTWTDSNGNLWLFGGNGGVSDSHFGMLNDLWKFDTVTREWAWINGSNQVDQMGMYGSVGMPASSNTPGSRRASMSWVDEHGDFWLFGGTDVNGKHVNDTWMFAVSGHLVRVDEADSGVLPGSYDLSTAYPNPFNDNATIQIAVQRSQRVRLRVYDTLGRMVAYLYDGFLVAGNKQAFTFEGDRLSSGVYLIHADGESFSASRQIVLSK